MKLRSVLFILIIATIVGCSKDDDTNDSSPTSKLIGTWVCVEQSQIFGTNTYSVDINPHSTISTRVVIDNFYNLGFQESHAQTDVNGNALTIINQTINGYSITGTGVLSNDSEIKLSYTTDDGAGVDNVTATLTKTN